MIFNEDSRVKLPTILHLCKLGYEYLSLSNAKWDKDTNIFPDSFYKAIEKLNPGIEKNEIKVTYDKLTLSLDNEDLGAKFYELLTSESGTKIIDFENFENNILQVVTELPCINGDEEFRPDITLLINGLPLVFIEVKKPNNLDGIQAEYKRIEKRFENKRFRKFVNITQLMIFSNNMPYDDEGLHPLQGAFYATTAYGKTNFNFFREEEIFDLNILLSELNEDTEDEILLDNNLISIKHSQEFITNKNPESLKKEIDENIRKNAHILENESFVEKMIMRLLISELKNKHNLPLDSAQSTIINSMILKEYMNEFYGHVA